MNKVEVKKITNLIKGYYNSEFFIDDYVLQAWLDTLEEYDYEDAENHIREYVKENPNIAPKPHTFIKGMLTKKQKEARKNNGYLIQCNLCGRWMSLQEYEDHYDRCLDIEYLIRVAKNKGEEIGREDLENCKSQVIEKLLFKYQPKGNVNFYEKM